MLAQALNAGRTSNGACDEKNVSWILSGGSRLTPPFG